MMPTLNSPNIESEDSESIKLTVQSSNSEAGEPDANDTKSNLLEIFTGGSTMMTFANGTMKVPNFIITNVKSLAPGSKVQNSIPGTNVHTILPITNVKNIVPITRMQNIVPITIGQNVVPISKIQNITPDTKSQTVALIPKMQKSSPVIKMQKKFIKKDNNEVSPKDPPQWLKSPIRRYVAKRRSLPVGTTSSKVQIVDQEHAYVSKHQSPVITMKKITIPQSSVRSPKSSDSTCRLCLKFRENLTPLIWGDRAKPELKLFLKECCSVEVSPDDPMPKSICCECRLKLISAWDFRNQCQKSDNELRKFHKLPHKNYSQPRVDSFVIQNDKEIQVECYDRSKKTKALRLIKEEKSDDEEASTDNHQVEEFNQTGNFSEENDENGENAVTYFLESFAQEISNDAENSAGNQPTELNEEADSEKQESMEKEITVKRNLRRKMKKKPQVEKGNFLCHMCPRVFTTKGFLERHAKYHLTEKTFTCETCSKVFKTEEKLTIHMRVHDKTKRFECEVCGLKYAYEYLLNSHLRLHGKGRPLNTEKHYLCEVCSKTFASQSGLKHHQKLHMDLKPFKCRFCEKTFTMPIYRKKHEVRHSDTRQFKCHLCPATYASTNGLTNHLLLHTGEAHYHCKTCGKSFRRRKYLNEHTFTHTGEKPYICKLCGMSYGNSGSLFAHQRRCRLQFAAEELKPTNEEVETETILEDFLIEDQI